MKISSLTDIGARREMNQDYLYSSEEAVGKLQNLFIVADGMGGHRAGEFASRYAVELIVDTVRKSEKKRCGGNFDGKHYGGKSAAERICRFASGNERNGDNDRGCHDRGPSFTCRKCG